MAQRTIRGMAENGKTYVYLNSEEIGNKFLQMAEHEGFTFDDGVKPTGRHYSDMMAVNSDGTIHYVGAIGRMAVGSGKAKRVDFEKYINEEQG